MITNTVMLVVMLTACASAAETEEASLPAKRRVSVMPSLRSGYTYQHIDFVGGPGVVNVVSGLQQDIVNVTFLDCDFSGGQQLVAINPKRVDGRQQNVLRNIRFIRCTFRGATGPMMKHSHGLYVSGVDGLVIEDCIFDSNGWAVDEQGQPVRWNQNHNVYLSTCRNVEIRRSKFLNASSIGIKARGLLGTTVIEDCTFEGNAIAIGTDTREPGSDLIVRRCTFDRTGVRAKGHDPLSWIIDAHKLTSLTIEGCRFGSVAERQTSFAVKIHKTVDAATLRDCDFTGYDGEKKIVNEIGDRLVRDNNKGL